MNLSAAVTRTTSALLASALLRASTAAAQTCEPPTDSNEAAIFGSRSLALAFGRGVAMPAATAGAVRVGFEAVLLPHIDRATATPTTCRPGKGPENVNALPAFARLRLGIVLPRRVAVEANWLPPVELEGIRGNLFGVSVSHWYRLTQGISAVGRFHATLGSVTGPFTCADEDLRDTSSECFGGTRSSDRYEPNIAGVDVSAELASGRSPLIFFAGAGYTRLMPRFRVRFRNAGGELDSTRVRVDLDRAAVFAGASRRLGASWRVGAEVYATPQDGATVRAVVEVIVRAGASR